MIDKLKKILCIFFYIFSISIISIIIGENIIEYYDKKNINNDFYYEIKFVEFKPAEEITLNYITQKNKNWEPIGIVDNNKLVLKKKIKG